jgi:NAD(P)-dependent dehydrogenase (short-subunit alcohol dehydrogenase family)
MTKVLAKEVAAFNVRALYVSLGGFNTNMSLVVARGTVPLDPDYKGSKVEAVFDTMVQGAYVPDGDKDKAMKALYEVVVGKGIGAGREAERVLPLGRDVAVRIQEVVDQWNHTMEVFGDVCNNVYQ